MLCETALHYAVITSISVITFQRTVLRIGLHSLGSPLWLEQCAVEPGNGYSTALPLFLHSLRGMLRQANAVAMITMPTHLFQVRIFYVKCSC